MTQRIEQQLRDAFAAGAELVRAETLRPSDRVPRREARPRLRRPLVLAPLMAALAVVVVSLTVVAGLGSPATVAGGAPPPPPFLLTAGDDGLSIRDAVTGKITERVAMPPTPKGNRLFNPGGYVLAGTGEGTTFYVAQSVTEPGTMVSTTRFYRLRVDDRGKTAEMAPDVIPPVTGAGPVVSLAVTQDGARLAYGFQCAGKVRCSGARLAIVDLAADKTRSWSADASESIKSLSWAADARTLAFVAGSEVRVLDTAAAGDTLAGSRVVVRGVESPVGVAISPDGGTIAVGGPFSQPDGEAPQRYSIEEYSVADGTRTRTLFTAENTARTVAKWTLIRYDATGRHLLIWGNVYPLSRLEDGQATVLVRPPVHPDPESPDASPQEMFAAW
ncbi:hypothetical protein [Microtetraspora niveoalba]|uniref:hypothetical protein n=1 Tax=Microtetraspora niveoalba TaxID=46175 RepID=UPI000A86D6B2|nr:hypothetical protein [Microtetraspora niveoalba]